MYQLIDTDLVWLHNPDLLFTAPGYVKTGGLYFLGIGILRFIQVQSIVFAGLYSMRVL
jgi:hypothetical protein